MSTRKGKRKPRDKHLDRACPRCGAASREKCNLTAADGAHRPPGDPLRARMVIHAERMALEPSETP